MGTLYIVSTPIGNLEDITFRAIKTLLSVDIIACEDTRRTGIMIEGYRKKMENGKWKMENLIATNKPQLISYYDEVEEKKIPEVIQYLIGGKSVALVSDAGTPLVSDPGYKLVRECIKRKIQVVSIPGSSSVLTALTSSGLPPDQFLFLGYLPSSDYKRKNLLMNLFQCFKSFKMIHPTVVFFESPHRLNKCLTDLEEVFGNITIVVARELTKVHEEVLRGSISMLSQSPAIRSPKGEFIILFQP